MELLKKIEILIPTMKFHVLIAIALFFFTTVGFGQLPNFTLNIAATPETCTNNGAGLITVNDADPDAAISFALFKAPNFSTPLNPFFTETTIGGLDSGDYRIIATQSLNGESNTATEDFTILNQLVPLVFTVVESTVNLCNQNGGILTVNVQSGTAPFFYEITAGTEIRPIQTSNQFQGLSSGIYRVRVIDACGADVFDYTLQLATTQLSIGATTTPAVATSCTSVEVLNNITPTEGTSIIYPITVTYTIYPPGLPTQTTVITYPSGPPLLLQLALTLPLFPDQPYTYDVLITDSCSIPYSSLGNLVDPNPVVRLSDNDLECGQKFFTLTASNFSPPYTVNFISVPAGFNPTAFNAAHPGPLTVDSLEYGGDGNPVPGGIYIVEITDSCNRTGLSAPLEIIVEALEPNVQVFNANCDLGLGRVRISLPEDRKIVSAEIIVAPSAYVPSLPSDVSSFIDSATGVLFVQNLPVGEYHFTLVDECGVVYEEADVDFAVIDVFQALNFIALPRPSCTSGSGSVRFRSPNGDLQTVIITDAPAEYEGPFDVSGLIDTAGVLYLAELPAGNYTFTGTDACGHTTQPVVTTIPGYLPGVNNFTITRNCGSFNLAINDNSNIVANTTYWFQRFNATTNSWEHPSTAVTYTEGTVPTALNAIQMTNNQTLINLSFIGTFRIVKIYQTWNAGSANCIQIYDSFTFSGDLVVLNAYNLDCDGGGGPTDVYLEVEGVPPYNFTIQAPFFQDNGSSNIYQGLLPGLYSFQVEDSCGRRTPYQQNIGILQPLVVANAPLTPELLECADPQVTTSTFDLTQFTASILGNQSPQDYLVTYHLSQQAASDGTGAIDNPEAFTNIVNPQPIFARVVHRSITICNDTTPIMLYIGTPPVLSSPPGVFVCDGGDVRLFADPGFDAYEWSTGETTSSILVNTFGSYSVTVRNTYGTMSCDNNVSFTVNPSSIASNMRIETSDWTEDQNTITITVDGAGNYVYSLDGINFQTSSVFSNLVPGVYKIFVDDINGCGTIDKEVALLNYPKFFTPNGDGYNEKWQIKFAVFEPELKIYIYDRYGKLITGFGSKSEGWDGMSNGKSLPSTDYWFVVERADGTIHRGHFAMKR